MALISPTGRPVAMRMRPKKRKEKNRRLTATTSRMRRHAAFEPIDPNLCMWGGVADVINCANFFENRSKGFGAVRPRKIAFPIEIVRRPYNSVGTTVPHCDGTDYKITRVVCLCVCACVCVSVCLRSHGRNF